MTRYCCVCHAEQSVKNSHRVFHSFPSNPERREKWLEALKQKKEGIVCSQHFRPEDYRELCDKPLLKIKAIPSLNIQYSEHSTTPMEFHKETQIKDNQDEDNDESVLRKSVVSTSSVKSSKRTNDSCDKSTVPAKKCVFGKFGIFRREDFTNEIKWNRFLTLSKALRKDKVLLQRKTERLCKKVKFYKNMIKRLKEKNLMLQKIYFVANEMIYISFEDKLKTAMNSAL